MTEHPIVRLRWVVLAIFFGVCAWLIPGVTQLQNDDDVLAFLPAEHPDVIGFQDVAKRFGMLEVALIGLADGDADLLTPERMDQVRVLTKDLETVDGVNVVLSAADLPNPIVNDEGLEVAPLVPSHSADNLAPKPVLNPERRAPSSGRHNPDPLGTARLYPELPAPLPCQNVVSA